MANELLTIFLDESQEHLQALNENVLRLESNPADIAVVGEIFRSAHTFKGMSATMGYTNMANLTHKMENVLDEIRNGRLSVSGEVIDVIFECIDSLEKMVADVQQGGTGNISVSSTMQRLEAFMNRDQAKRQIKDEQAVEAGPAEATHIVRVTISESALLKAVRAIMCLEAIQRVGELLATEPAIDKIEADEFGTQFAAYLITNHDAEEVRQAVLSISEIEAAEVQSLEEKQEEVASAPAAGATAAPKPAAKGAKVESRTIRVQLEKIEKLMNMFEESVIERGRISELADAIANKELIEHLNRLGDISKDIQNLLLNMRMVPIETVFNRFPRMVRSLAKDLGKKIDLQIVGEDTEVDKIVIDEISDPLVHLIRNAIDHGVETVEERLQAGKSETGLIKLEAFHSGNHVVIQITDDGRGINKVKVLQKAISKGIVTEAEALKMSDREVHELIFSSGFSTAEVVSDLSGRGVGMDVVKHTIHSLGGHLMIESEEGRGSTFRIELPLTLSIIQSMLVQTNERRYAFPLGNVVEAIRVSQEEIQVIQGKHVLNYRDQIIEVIGLGDVFGEKQAESGGGSMIPVLIVRNTRRSYGLIVTGIIGQREIVLKSLGDFFANSSKYFSGATILGDGRVVLIVNPEVF
ncbi:chemotaxis protein CheA [Ectobacillus ponti]|uniref:Chemotaxis protein CheA n=1 Tax=Ectobacillus ponti TaxID=2961894 RepID=A0AA41X9L6_9BACI|nr:chemotaxis protein CheA [Ectobacillus ponti]MCP8968828.1 chemotaxis protein CheA [Ectobacillus ponti]